MKNNNHNLKKTYSFFLLLIVVFLGYTQPKTAEEIKEFVWGANDTYKEIPSVPEKWEKESAVVIFDNQNHYYNKNVKSLDNFFLTRRIIKLNDKAAVEKFSEFNYPTFIIDGIKEIKTWMGIKIIKPDGSVKEIDVEKEKIKTSTDKSMYIYGFIKAKMKSDQIFKLAIPEIEIGDIIDYYVYSYEEYKTYGNYVMDAIETTLGGEYPTMDFLLKLKVENDFFINFNTFNGAPKLEDITKEKQRDKEYRLIAKNIEKRESQQWVYPLLEYPCYKYQICFAKSGRYEDRTFAFLSEKEDIVKEQVNSEEILKKFEIPFSTDLIGKNIKKHFKNKEYSKEDLAKNAYYYMRHFYYNRYIEAAIADQENFLGNYYSPYTKYKTSAIVISNRGKFLVRYASFLKKHEIPFDIVITKHRYDGTIDDLLIRGNLNWFIRVTTQNPFFAFPIDNNMMINWIPPTIEGNNAYALKYDEKYSKIEKVEKFNIPVSSYLDNNTKEILDIAFDDDFSGIAIEKKSSHKGHNKVSQIDNKLTYLDYLPEERKKFGTTTFADFFVGKTKQKYDELNAAYIEKLTKKKIEVMKEDEEEEYDFKVNDYKCTIDNGGRYNLNDDFMFTEKYSVKDDLIKKAGPNYIFEVGKLIGNQVSIEEKDKKRGENIHMSYPRSFSNEINLTIPEGYSVSGYKELNKKIENETGGFTSEASMNGNVLSIKTHKYYKNNFEPNKNWSKMLEFLEVSYQFSQEKILLKKKS